MLVIVMLAGNAGAQALSANVAGGTPVAVKLKLFVCDGMKMAELALVMVGGRLMSMLTVAAAESSNPSFVLKVKLSLVVAPALGV